MKTPRVTLYVPTLNEVEGVREIMPRINPEWHDQLLIVDGQSTDGTFEYFKEHKYSVLSQKRKGTRWHYFESLEHIDGDIIITFSPDGNSIPELIPDLIDKMKEGYDMVIVSRYLDGKKSGDDTHLTYLANKFYTFMINLLYGSNYTDAMIIYRAYKVNLIRLLDLDKDSGYWLGEKISRTSISWELLLSIRCAKRKLAVAEIPGGEPIRLGGRRGAHWRWGLGYLVQLFQEVFYWR
jgi:glycosyltransferase involved in cell wall biosynthesis